MIDAPFYQKYQVTTIKHKAQDQNPHTLLPLPLKNNSLTFLIKKKDILQSCYRVVIECECGVGSVFYLDTRKERDMSWGWVSKPFLKHQKQDTRVRLR